MNPTLMTLSEENQQQIALIAEGIAEQKIQELPPNTMQSREVLKNRIKDELIEQLTEFYARFVQGAQILIETMQNLSQQDPTFFSQEMIEQLGNVSDALAIQAENPNDNRSPKIIAGITDQSMEIFNKAAAFLYTNKDYDKAAAVYGFLTYLDPSQTAFWLGYGNAEYFNQHFDKALEAYEIVGELNPEDPHSHFFTSHCYHELNQLDKALDCANKALEVAKKNPEMKEWIEPAEALQAFFSEMLNKH